MILSKEECTLIIYALDNLEDKKVIEYLPGNDISDDLEEIGKLKKKIARGK